MDKKGLAELFKKRGLREEQFEFTLHGCDVKSIRSLLKDAGIDNFCSMLRASRDIAVSLLFRDVSEKRVGSLMRAAGGGYRVGRLASATDSGTIRDLLNEAGCDRVGGLLKLVDGAEVGKVLRLAGGTTFGRALALAGVRNMARALGRAHGRDALSPYYLPGHVVNLGHALNVDFPGTIRRIKGK